MEGGVPSGAPLDSDLNGYSLADEADIATTSPPVPEGYDNLIDEYSILDNALQGQFETVDIIDPVSSEEEKEEFIARNNKVSDLVSLLSTPAGCREWIRREMMCMESAFLSSKSVRIFASTWNVNGKKPVAELDSWLADDANLKSEPDVYFLGLQEVQPLSGLSSLGNDESRGAAWRDAVEKAVAKVGAYVTLGAKQMIGIFVIVLVKKVHRPFVQNVSIVEAGTGFMRTGGNKGGVSCRFVMYDKRICCVSSHLAAHDYNLERRNQDFHDVIRKTVFEIETPEKSPFSYRDSPDSNVEAAGEEASAVGYATSSLNILEHDIVIWLGDLNYRIELAVEKVVALIDDANWSELRKYDQLINTMESGEVFQGFEEQTLDFKPTYKHAAFADEYEMNEEDKTLKRKPAWTDRVLWRDRVRSTARDVIKDITATDADAGGKAGGMRASAYRRHEIFMSDHRPVSATFDVDIDIINSTKRNKTVEDIHRNLRKRQNLLRPRLSLSPSMIVEFGKIAFDNPVDSPAPIVIHNLGHVPIHITIEKDSYPAWLHVGGNKNGLAFQLAPFERRPIRFRAHVRPGFGVSTKLNMGTARFTASVPLSIHGKSDVFITVVGDYTKTCFGNTITDLAAHPAPLVAGADGDVAGDSPSKDSSSARPPTPVPKEIYYLISFLIRVANAGAKKGDGDLAKDAGVAQTNKALFVEESSDAEMLAVRLCLDEGKAIPEGTATAAVTSCLVALLESQEEPLIPFKCYEGCIALVLQGKFSMAEIEHVLTTGGAKAPVYNTLVYLSAFLSQLPGMQTESANVSKDDSGQKTCVNPAAIEDESYYGKVLTLFTKVIFRPPADDEEDDGGSNDGAPQDWNERISFVATLLMLCGGGGLDVVFDHST